MGYLVGPKGHHSDLPRGRQGSGGWKTRGKSDAKIELKSCVWAQQDSGHVCEGVSGRDLCSDQRTK